MTKKIHSILLVDDDDATNYLNRLTLKKLDCADEVHISESGSEALQYLQKNVNGDYPHPDLIFLDINMPAMDGWEFLEEYKKLPPEMKGKIVEIMLTTSLNPDDMRREI